MILSLVVRLLLKVKFQVNKSNVEMLGNKSLLQACKYILTEYLKQDHCLLCKYLRRNWIYFYMSLKNAHCLLF